MAYTTINKSTDYFNTLKYVGNGSDGHAITGVGFKPDWVWTKNRDHAADHYIHDIVRGVEKAIRPNNDNATYETSINLQSFDTDGFTVGTQDGLNKNGDNIVSWNWLAGGNQGSSNTDGSINTTYTSVNQTAGISISTYTGTGSNATVGHGLGAVPKFIMVKDLGASIDWLCYHSAIGATKNLRLNTNEQVDTSSTIWYNTEPTSSVFSIGTATAVNANGNNYVAYCFSEIPGFSIMGKHKGNGAVDGGFVYTGFKPAFVMVRYIDSGNGYDWIMYDNKRPNSSNPTPNILEANTSDTENTSSNFNLDIVCNGFKFRGTESNVNDGGYDYLYWAVAEAPLVGSGNVPANAR